MVLDFDLELMSFPPCISATETSIVSVSFIVQDDEMQSIKQGSWMNLWIPRHM